MDPPKPPIPLPKTCPCRSLHSTMHSYTFPYKEGRVLRDLEGGLLGGGKRGAWRFMKTRGFRFLNPGLRNLRFFKGKGSFMLKKYMFSLDAPNRQLPIASVQRTRSTLTDHSAGPRGANTTPTNTNGAMRIAAQRTQCLWGPHSVFLGGYITANEC